MGKKTKLGFFTGTHEKQMDGKKYQRISEKKKVGKKWCEFQQELVCQETCRISMVDWKVISEVGTTITEF